MVVHLLIAYNDMMYYIRKPNINVNYVKKL